MRKSSWAVLLFILAACTRVNVEDIPWVETPDSWMYEPEEALDAVNFRWWKEFGDEVLNGYIVEALHNNQDLLRSSARVEEFFARVQIATSPLFPLVTGNAFGQRLEVSNAATPGFIISPRVYNDFGLSFSASYELDVWSKIRSNLQAAKLDFRASEEAKRTVVLTLVTSVAEAYFSLLQYDRQLKVSLDSLKSFQEAYDIALYRFQGGITSELPVKQADSEVQVAKGRAVLFELQVATQENLINVLLGRAPQPVQRGLKLSAMHLPKEVPAGIPADVLKNRPDVARAAYDMMASSAKVNVEFANLFPDITLTGNYGNESTSLGNLLSNPALLWAYGVNIFQTVFDANKLVAEVNVAEAVRRQLVHNYVSTVLNAFKEVESALITNKKRREYLQVQIDRVAVLKDYLELAQLQYSNGQTDYLNVLDAQRNLFNAQLDEVAAFVDTYTSLIEVYKALGGGWVVDAENIAGGCPCD
jgi:multidrug efflux system outer membrane protein